MNFSKKFIAEGLVVRITRKKKIEVEPVKGKRAFLFAALQKKKFVSYTFLTGILLSSQKEDDTKNGSEYGKDVKVPVLT